MTQLAKHTPGPWQFTGQTAKQVRLDADDGTDGGGACGSISAFDHHNRYGQTIVFLPHNRDANKDNEWLANAHLIAAAPAMYEALKELREHSDTVLRDIGLPHDDAMLMLALIDNATRALAQAEGRG